MINALRPLAGAALVCAALTFAGDAGATPIEFQRVVGIYYGTVSVFESGSPQAVSSTDLVELTDYISDGMRIQLQNPAPPCDGYCGPVDARVIAALEGWIDASGPTNVEWTLAPPDGLPAALRFDTAVSALSSGALSVDDPGFQFVGAARLLGESFIDPTTAEPVNFYGAFSFYERNVVVTRGAGTEPGGTGTVPEPVTVALLGVGMAALLACRRRAPAVCREGRGPSVRQDDPSAPLATAAPIVAPATHEGAR